MPRILTYIFLLSLLTISVRSQDFDNYHLLRAEGPIPEDFLASSTEKFQASVDAIEKNTNSRERNLRKRFYLESNFGIDDLLLSGRVLFNDAVSKYLNKVADEVLSHDPELRKQLRFYVLKSPIPNAFTTEQGIVFVNMGLLPRLDNEAQLAFILCHEIAHFVEHHVIEGYVASAQIDLNKGEYRKSSAYEKLMLKNLYSRDHEMAADIKGFALFAKTKYSAESIPAVFDILKNAEYPHLLPELPGTIFHTDDLDLNDFDTYYVKILQVEAENSDDEIDESDDEVSGREARRLLRENTEEEDEEAAESLSTHPSPDTRRDAIVQELIKLQPKGEATFRISAAEFERIQKIANFELCDIFLQANAFYDALHHVLALKDLYPNSTFLEFAKIRALYGQAKYKIEGEKYDHYLNYDDLEGVVHAFYKYSKRINSKKLTVMALSHAWTYARAHPDNRHAAVIVEDLLVDLLEDYPNLISGKSRRDSTINDFFEELRSQDAFAPVLDKCIKERKRLDDFDEFSNTRKGRKVIYNWEKKNQRKGYRLGIDTVIVFAPQYYRVDVTKKNKPPVQYIASEEQQEKLHDFIEENGEDLGLKVILLDTKTLESNEVDLYNDAAVAYTWYDERLRSEVKMFPSNYLDILALSEKYGSSYFLNMGAFSVRMKPILIEHPGVMVYSVYLLFLWPAIPVFLYAGLKPREASLSYTLVFDVEKNTTVMAYRKTQKIKADDAILGNNIYHMLRQVKKSSKKSSSNN